MTVAELLAGHQLPERTKVVTHTNRGTLGFGCGAEEAHLVNYYHATSEEEVKDHPGM